MEEEASIYAALVLGVRDYVRKNGFGGAVLGLSGGVDSALTLAIAVDALGADAVEGVLMPSRYTSEMSNADALEEAASLGVKTQMISIEPAFRSFLSMLEPAFEGRAADVTEENIQARCRGIILMAISNKTGRILLTTGNKSEMAVGYATLYGDMAGGFRADQGRAQAAGLSAGALSQSPLARDPGAGADAPALRGAAAGSDRSGQPSSLRGFGCDPAALYRGRRRCRRDRRARLSGRDRASGHPTWWIATNTSGGKPRPACGSRPVPSGAIDAIRSRAGSEPSRAVHRRAPNIYSSPSVAGFTQWRAS